MRRKSFDTILTAGGAVLTVVLVVAGVLLMWGYNFANSQVHNQLAKQEITFPTTAAFAHAKPGTEITPGMIPYLEKYAGEPLTTGPQAEAYADHFIAIHLSEMPYGGVYSKVSAASMANPKNAALATEVQTVFRGTTLRGLLLEAYGFWKFGEIAMVSAICSFVLAAVMLVLTLLGLVHRGFVTEDEAIFAVETPQPELVTV